MQKNGERGIKESTLFGSTSILRSIAWVSLIVQGFIVWRFGKPSRKNTTL